ncbi:MAG: cyclic nucleotide-binding domain-containing protein [Candidatus Aminicenantes bacterium]|nr:cyclic nucleotide-binding domain-containing protein [Candidatus Aminicenantes bacterium]
MLTTVEKVLFLQDVDIFEYTSTEDLAHIAGIVDEIELKPDEIIFKEGEIPDAMYIVSKGKVILLRAGQKVMVAKEKDVFGTWALFDDEPRVATATTLEDTRLLRIDREDFIDLLADNVAITQSIMKTLVKRLRNLMNRISK